MHATLIAISLSGLLLLTGQVPLARADGPWRAQIVDADTKEALQGVVVLAVWTKHVRGLGGASSEYHDSEEVLTEQEGRFTIPARRFSSLNPLVFFRGPEFIIFRPGYGRWDQYARYPTASGKKDRYERDLLIQDHIVVELPRLKTLEERKAFMQSLSYPKIPCCEVPSERTRWLRKALDEDRVAVGLPPGYSR